MGASPGSCDWPANLARRLVATGLLFLAMERMTRSLWPSAFAAAVFALHPLHVESVAWASQRKDALAAVFWMATLLPRDLPVGI